jgi:hypothetical protein
LHSSVTQEGESKYLKERKEKKAMQAAKHCLHQLRRANNCLFTILAVKTFNL